MTETNANNTDRYVVDTKHVLIHDTLTNEYQGTMAIKTAELLTAALNEGIIPRDSENGELDKHGDLFWAEYPWHPLEYWENLLGGYDANEFANDPFVVVLADHEYLQLHAIILELRAEKFERPTPAA